jgi:hypothetical protein
VGEQTVKVDAIGSGKTEEHAREGLTGALALRCGGGCCAYFDLVIRQWPLSHPFPQKRGKGWGTDAVLLPNQ